MHGIGDVLTFPKTSEPPKLNWKALRRVASAGVEENADRQGGAGTRSVRDSSGGEGGEL